jgi:hypothetical protein
VIDVVRAIVAAAVDEEGRRAGHAAQVRALDVLSDAVRAGAPVQVVGEARHVEPESIGVRHQIGHLQPVLVREQQVVHLPERALIGGGLRGQRRQLGVRMHVCKRQVPPHVADVREVAEQLADDGFRPPAVRALEVAVLDHGYRRVVRSADVVRLGVDRELKVEERLCAAEQRGSATPGRQQADDAEHQPRHGRRADGGGEDPRLGLLELCAAEGQRRDEQRDGEAHASTRPCACHGPPASRRPQPSA